MTGSNNALVLGTQSSRQQAAPGRVDTRVWKYHYNSIPTTTNSGGTYQIVLDSGPTYPGSRDTFGLKGTGFKLTDFVPTTLFNKYDHFRINKVEVLASLSNIPRGSQPNVLVFSSVDYDDAQISTAAAFMERPNKSLTVLTGTAPTQKLIDYVPRRRVSSNVDPSFQILPKPNEWCDVAYAGTLLFGNHKIMCLAPDGQVQYPVDNQCSVLITSRIWVEFKARL